MRRVVSSGVSARDGSLKPPRSLISATVAFHSS